MSENSIEFSLSNSEQRDSWLNSGHRTLDADILCFFILKKNGILQLVQDYKWLNQHTIKNKIPLFLINEVINKLKDAKYFNKLDLIWGYNNIQIKDDDE